jgi:hypothetical protein
MSWQMAAFDQEQCSTMPLDELACNAITMRVLSGSAFNHIW